MGKIFFLKFYELILVLSGCIISNDVWAEDDLRTPVLEQMEVTPFSVVGSMNAISSARNKYHRLPEEVRKYIDLNFYLAEEATGQLVAGLATSKVKLKEVMPNGQSRVIHIDEGGAIHLMVSSDVNNTKILANAVKGQFKVVPRLTIKLPQDEPITLGYMRKTLNAFLIAYKPFASIVFRAFIGEKKPNCFGMSFFSPEQILIHEVPNENPVWESARARRITIFLDDLKDMSDQATLSWSGSHEPYFVAACLLDKNDKD